MFTDVKKIKDPLEKDIRSVCFKNYNEDNI